MHRFFIDRIDGDKGIISDSAQLHHLRDVLRLKIDDRVVVSDGKGNEYLGMITGLDRQQAELRVSPVKSSQNRSIQFTVACAIPKGNRMDEVIDYLTQLGVTDIIPMLTERVVVKLNNTRAEVRLQRWRKIARNAAQQSQRSVVPLVEPVTDIKDVISSSHKYNLKLIPTLEGERKHIREVISGVGLKDILVLIGPEGDFTPEEINLALAGGFIPVSLGDDVLRVATAAIAVASYIKFAVDN